MKKVCIFFNFEISHDFDFGKKVCENSNGKFSHTFESFRERFRLDAGTRKAAPRGRGQHGNPAEGRAGAPPARPAPDWKGHGGIPAIFRLTSANASGRMRGTQTERAK